MAPALASVDVRIANRCPGCGHQTLFIGNGGWITCSWIGCKAPSIDEAFEQSRVDIICASQLRNELEEARREALAMRDERDREIAARKAVERGAGVELAHLMFGIRGGSR